MIPTGYHESAFRLPDGQVACLRRAGVPTPGVANTTLIRAVEHFAGRRIFVAGPGAAATLLWATRRGAEVTYWTENLAEAQSVAATCAANACPLPTTHCAPDFSGLEPGAFDTVLLHLPRGQYLQRELLQLGAALLAPGGWLAFGGATREGIRSALQVAREIFGQAGITTRKGGYHAGLAQRPTGDFPLPADAFTCREITVSGAPTQLHSRPGVFAWDRLDEGAATLIDHMHVTAGQQALDLGCGPGLVGLAALRQGAHVTLVDVSAWAVAAAQRTLAANGYPEAPVWHSHGAEAVATQRFDVVLTNPPFHQGHGVNFEVAQRFIHDAAHVLHPGGKLYLVANSFLDYGTALTEHFSDVRPVGETTRFRVWEGVARAR